MQLQFVFTHQHTHANVAVIDIFALIPTVHDRMDP